MECKQSQNSKNCTCTYPGCPRKGKCCECITYHKNNGELPGCFFTSAEEKSYDRSIANFIANKQT
ncbi:hypothetical protein KKA15_03990 [Patescibacteria group bacterium]|nr:hypothetical protein [Patescibacteria group bacterium]